MSERVTLYLPDDIIETIDTLAKTYGIPKSKVVLNALHIANKVYEKKGFFIQRVNTTGATETSGVDND